MTATLENELTAADVGTTLGVDANTVNYWARQGFIAATKKPRTGGGRGEFWITGQAIVDFLKTPRGEKYRAKFRRKP